MRTQMLVQDTLEYIVCRQIAHRFSNLNPTVDLFQPPNQQYKLESTDTNESKENMLKEQEESNKINKDLEHKPIE